MGKARKRVECEKGKGVVGDLSGLSGFFTPVLRFGNITVYTAVPTSSETSELEGDNAIEVAINSSVPSVVKHKTQQVYVVNATDSQQKGTVDYLVVQNSPQRRWLINYITTGESYLNAQNLSSVVYVLELTNKTASQITQEVGAFINATK